MGEFMSGHPTAHSQKLSKNAKVKGAAEATFLAKLSALFKKLKMKKQNGDFYFLRFGRCY